jgi:hypothetical protein
VDVARYLRIANPVHDPYKVGLYENYAHVEVRELLEEEDFDVEPPRNRRKIKRRHSLRLAWRENLALQLIVELAATAI